uniref:Uncharacterized protein n=1 Tax=Daphnia galeata TaxID=27404 RepID=A0A8J2WH90_9CRUS|nr:unnamed protein product [Daphnia galeata]
MESPKSDYDCSSLNQCMIRLCLLVRLSLSIIFQNKLKTQYNRVHDIWRNFCRENDVPELGEDHKPLAACLSLCHHAK